MHDSLLSPFIAPRNTPYFFRDKANTACASLAISLLEALSFTFVITIFTIAGDLALDQKNHDDKDYLVASHTFITGVIICALKNIHMGVGRNWYLNHPQRDVLLLRNTSISFFSTLFISAPATQFFSSKEKTFIGELIGDQLLGMVIVCGSLLAIYKTFSYGINKWCYEEEDEDEDVVIISPKYLPPETSKKIEMTAVVSGSLDDDTKTLVRRLF